MPLTYRLILLISILLCLSVSSFSQEKKDLDRSQDESQDKPQGPRGPRQNCQNQDEAYDQFINLYIDPQNIPTYYAALSEQCQQLLASHDSFIREVEYSLEILGTHFRYPERLEAEDLELLTELKSFLGQTPTQEQTQIFNNQMNKVRESCTPKDQRSKLPPIRHQSTIGWCYAYTAADMVSYSSGQNISAVDLAVSYNTGLNISSFTKSIRATTNALTGPNKLNIRDRLSQAGRNLSNMFTGMMLTSEREGGRTVQTIERASLNGFCLESDLSSTTEDTRMLGALIEYIAFYDNEFRSETTNDPFMSDVAADAICSKLGNVINEIFGSVTTQDISNIMQSMHQVDLLNALTQLSCKNRFSLEGNVETLPNLDRFGHVDRLLEEDQIVGISYTIDALGLNSSASQTTGRHASTIVGRKWNDESNRCEYLIRNSWGESCDYYEDQTKCEAGNIWVDRDTLRRSVSEAYNFN